MNGQARFLAVVALLLLAIAGRPGYSIAADSSEALVNALSGSNRLARINALDSLEAGWPAGRIAVKNALSEPRYLSGGSQDLIALTLLLELIKRTKDHDLYGQAAIYIKHPDARIRQRVIDMAGRFNDDTAKGIFLKSINDSDKGVREMATRRLFLLLGPTAADESAKLAQSTDISIRAPAVEVLGYLGKKDVHDQALALISSSTESVRLSGCQALGYIGAPSDQSVLVQAHCKKRDLLQYAFESIPADRKADHLDQILRHHNDIEVMWAKDEIYRSFQLKNNQSVVEYFNRTLNDATHPAHDDLLQLAGTLQRDGLR